MAENFNTRLIKAMSQMVNPSKSSTAVVPTKNGGKYTYKYETLDQVLAAVRPPLYDNGIGLTQSVSRDAESGGYILSTIVFDEENRVVLDTRPITVSADAQACGSYETYMRRYALRTAFGLAGEDDDGAATKAPEKPHAAPKPPAKKAPSRAEMTKRILELKGDLIRAGYTTDELDSYMEADFGTTDLKQLADEQISKYGKQLSLLAKQSKEG